MKCKKLLSVEKKIDKKKKYNQFASAEFAQRLVKVKKLIFSNCLN